MHPAFPRCRAGVPPGVRPAFGFPGRRAGETPGETPASRLAELSPASSFWVTRRDRRDARASVPSLGLRNRRRNYTPPSLASHPRTEVHGTQREGGVPHRPRTSKQLRRTNPPGAHRPHHAPNASPPTFKNITRHVTRALRELERLALGRLLTPENKNNGAATAAPEATCENVVLRL